jgi:glycosyltransferase involved in cell wall biosynthesis
MLGILISVDTVKAAFGGRLAKLRFGLDHFLRTLGTDLVILYGDDGRLLQMLTHNYVVQLWDLCHLEQPEFAEVAHAGEFERRERINRSALLKATAIVVDSNYGKQLVHDVYRVTPSRIHAAPFLVDTAFDRDSFNSATDAAVRQRYQLQDPYIFYPAQFWPHKNHRYILAAVRAMRDRGAPVPQVVFSGSDKGALQEVMALARDLGVAANVKYCGFVPSEHMPYLYRGALALVMPTYFGPTNIPPMEAAALGVPVCYSDLPAFREQMGDRAIYVDLQEPQSLARELERLIAAAPQADATARSNAVRSPAIDAIQQHVEILASIIRGYIAKRGLQE